MTRVLIVDDEKSLRVTLRAFLQAAGYEVTVAEDAAAALVQLRQQEPDVVLTDIVMPHATGLDLLAQVRVLAPKVQVVLMTGEPTAETAAAAVRGDAFDYLFKPVARDLLLKTVASAARFKALNDERDRLLLANQRYQSDLEQLVTQRTQALRSSESQSRELVERLPDGVAILADGKLVYVNPALALLLQLPAAELTGRPLLEFVHPESSAMLQTHLAAVLRGETLMAYRKTLQTATGHILHTEVTALTCTHAGAPAVQFVVRDLTRQKALETQFLQAQKMEPIGRLAGGVAHDFNNLLSVILGFGQFALERAHHDTKMQEELREVLDAANRATELTRQLLAFSRRQTLSIGPVDPNRVIEHLSKMLRRLIGEDIHLNCQLAPDLGQINGDVGQLEQVLINLAVNARDAMPRGGSLTISTCNQSYEPGSPLPVGISQSGDYVQVEVSDTGTGMTPETMSHLFEPFFTTKGVGAGTGLGLATCYGIVTQHGGTISATSVVGVGTTFTLLMPRIAAATAAEQAVSAGSLPCGHEGILVVEDDAGVGRMIEHVLRHQGYRVLLASGPAAAETLFAVHEHELSLLLTDVVMPVMDGPELAARLCARRPQLKVLYITGYTSDSVAGTVRPTVRDAVLRKPFTREVLTRRVRELLDATEAG